MVAIFPKLSFVARDFMRVAAGKNGCLLYVCNARLISLRLRMEEDGRGWSSNYGGASFEGAGKTFVLGI